MLIHRIMVNLTKVFGALTEKDVLEPDTSGQDFRFLITSFNEIGHHIYVFDRRHQSTLTVGQPNKLDFQFDGVLPNHINGYALVLTNILVSVSCDEQNHFGLFLSVSFHNARIPLESQVVSKLYYHLLMTIFSSSTRLHFIFLVNCLFHTSVLYH